MLTTYEKRLIGRYLLPGTEGRIVLLVAAIGLTAVAIGVAALIVVMSVMNGVRTKLSIQFAGIDGHASITRPGQDLGDWRSLRSAALRRRGIVAAVPALDASAMASVDNRVIPVTVRGLRLEDMQTDRNLAGGAGSFLGRLPRSNEEVVIGAELAANLPASIGSYVTIMRPALKDGTLSVESSGYLITGLFHTGLPQHDRSLIVMNLRSAQQMLKRGDVASRINLTTADAEKVDEVVSRLAANLRGRAALQTWRDLNKPIFDALALDQIGMFIGLSLIVLVALFNIMSSLMMLVRSKIRDIGIMRTMGASRASILKVFVAIGTAIGSSGTLLGSGIGLSLVAAKEDIAEFLKAYVLANSYQSELTAIIDLPAEIRVAQLVGIAAMAIMGSILATLYPAIKAANVDPASILRHH